MKRQPITWSPAAVAARCKPDGECQLWQEGTATNGLPRCCVSGKLRQVRTFLFVDLLGGKLEDGFQVIVTCGRPLCLAPAHMAPATRSQAMKAHAVRAKAKDPLYFTRPASKFTAEQRERIRRESGTYAEKAVRHGCSSWTIGRICKVRSLPKPEPLPLPPQANSVFDFARTL